ncbi:MAG: hypothetical protein G01um101470_1034 [Parcubacteria group bacterium Gr01-1014_70]|nr:MAG: hypothetical protein G01um101470_1034 [Parcubacteria group bacterium Gr01-1014_70]
MSENPIHIGGIHSQEQGAEQISADDDTYESVKTEFKGITMEGARNIKTGVVERAVGLLPDKSRVELTYTTDTGTEKEVKIYNKDGELIEFVDIAALAQANKDVVEYLKTLLVFENEEMRSKLRGEPQHGH